MSCDMLPGASQEQCALIQNVVAEDRPEVGLSVVVLKTVDNQAEILRVLATPRRHVNVLQHIAGYFKRQLDAEGRAEVQVLIEEYRRGLVPLVVPLTLIGHHVRRFAIAYLQQQVYLQPHPKFLISNWPHL